MCDVCVEDVGATYPRSTGLEHVVYLFSEKIYRYYVVSKMWGRY